MFAKKLPPCFQSEFRSDLLHEFHLVLDLLEGKIKHKSCFCFEGLNSLLKFALGNIFSLTPLITLSDFSSLKLS